jgi:Asp-tRNA(Asn)/Glu-tRNA(Gln) amidotransferase A subunit family amidase
MLHRSTDQCLARIAVCDQEIQAWVEVSPQPPLAEGPLSGIPFGAKDIFETTGMATEYGSPLYAGRKGSCEAAIVTHLRRLGAILLGKTRTTAFASFDPPPTRNPRDLRRTPGGSSSGSAAAVAAGMAGFALGSQTQGSVLRPASYCGVVGFKPTFGLISRDGVLPFAPSLDTVGFFTETVADIRELAGIACDLAGPVPTGRTRMAAFRDPGIADTVERLRAAGFPITAMDPPAGFDRLLDASRLINCYEGARTHEQRWREHGDRIGRKLSALVAEGLAVPAGKYEQALETVRQMQAVMADFFCEFPVVLTEASPGPDPLGFESTGDPANNATWTALGVPAISIPMPVSGPPLGLQITAAASCDAALVAIAAEVESCLC